MAIQPRKAHIINVATELFHRSGYFQVGIAEINREADVSKGVFYHYFPGGKQELVKAVLLADYDRLDSQIRTMYAQHSFLDATHQYIATIKQELRNDADNKVRVNLLLSEMSEAEDIDSAITDLAKDIYTIIETVLSQKLIDAGEPASSALMKSRTINLMIEGAISIGVVKDTTNYLDIVDASLERIIQGD